MTSFDLIPEHRDPPDLERFVAALLAFTLARLEAEKQGAKKDSRPAEERDD
jgi:hypothetical protein